jgi:myosin-crossreactive antigen
MFEVGDITNRKVHLVGSGIASLAAAAYLIRDGGMANARWRVQSLRTVTRRQRF